ncbi:hypothetical protein VNI00_017683 [Paramarasmius palmivorus]|uniref:Uncharacterized protein n=1 Tax=Paramarasmius palmivorus TaxID=297713 RepID=A0AAW0B508_9AGAR
MLDTNAANVQKEVHHPGKTSVLDDDSLLAVLKTSISLFIDKGQSVTPLLLMKKGFETALQQILYRRVKLRNVEQLYLFEDSLRQKDFLAGYVRQLRVCSACTPGDVDNPAYTNPYYTRIPGAVAFVVTSTSSTVRFLSLEVSQHPVIIHAFRTTIFPQLTVLEVNHYMLLAPDAIAGFNQALIRGVREMDPSSEIHRTSQLSVGILPVLPWPTLERLVLLCEVTIPDYATPPFDYRYITKPIDIAIVQDGGFDGMFNYDHFLRHLKLPLNVQSAVLVDETSPEYLRQHPENQWHPKTLIVPYPWLQASPNSTPHAMPLISNTIGSDIYNEEFWTRAREVVMNRTGGPTFHNSLENSLLPELYKTIKVTTSTKIAKLRNTLVGNALVASMVQNMFIACEDRANLGDDENGGRVATHVGDVVHAIAPTVVRLTIRLETLPDVLYTLRAIPFPELREIQASYYYFLDISTSIKLHSRLKQYFREGHRNDPPKTKRLTIASDQGKFPQLERVFAICGREDLEYRGTIFDMSHLNSVKELVFLMESRSGFAFDVKYYLKRLVPPADVEVIVLTSFRGPAVKVVETERKKFDRRIVIPRVGPDGEIASPLYYYLNASPLDDVYWTQLKRYVQNRKYTVSLFHAETFKPLVLDV